MSSEKDHLKQIILGTSSNSLDSTIQIVSKYMKNEEVEKAAIHTINSLISNPKTGSIGMELINAIIQHCSVNILTENAQFWLNKCTICKGHDDLREVKLDIIEKLIKAIGEVETFNKRFVSEHLPDVIKSYLTSEGVKSNLKCLIYCMEKYPSSFVNYKEKIEKFLVKFLENSSKCKVKEAAVAFHFLQQTGSAGVEGVNYINNFRHQFKKMCATVDNLYDDFFENIQEFDYQSKNDSEVFIFDKLPSEFEQVKVLEVISQRILNCLVFVEVMIMRKFPVEKQITPKYILDIIIRGLSTHICLSEENSSLLTKKQALLLINIQRQLFRLLRIYAVGNSACLLPYSHLLTKTLLNTLKRTSDCICLVNDSFYKEQFYKILYLWIELNVNVNQIHFEETLITLLIKEVTVNERRNLLNLNVSKNKKPDKKEFHLNKMQEKYSSLILDILKCLLKIYPLKVSQQLWQEFISFAIQSLNSVHENKTVMDKEYVIKLYDILILLLEQEHRSFVLPIHLIISVLNKGINNVDNRISQTAHEGLRLLEKISSPVCCPFVTYECSNLPLNKKNQRENLNTDDGEKCSLLDEINYVKEAEDYEVVISINEETTSTEKVNILSNIVINESAKGKPESGENMETDVEIIDNIDVEDDSEEDNSKKSVLNGHKNDTEVVATEIEEPPKKKKKDEEVIEKVSESQHSKDDKKDALKEMLSAFEDEVQFEEFNKIVFD